MTVKVIASFSTLMGLAYELGQARLSKDPERIAKAKANHDAYKAICLEADEISLGAMLK